jgi:cytochrome c-type biogenesis protein CcmH/NrfG
MNEKNLNQDEQKLGELLREARVALPLPPRFQQNVWRLIENEEARLSASPDTSWLDAFAVWVLRPRLAFAVAALLVLMGGGMGWNNGRQLAQSEAQNRYLTAVAPSVLH